MSNENTNNEELPIVDIMGTNVHAIYREEAMEKVGQFLNDGHQHYIVTVNPEFLITADSDKKFQRILNSADLSLPDGNGLIWSSYFLNREVDVPNTFPKKKQKVYRKRKIKNQLLLSLLLNCIYPPATKKFIPERITGVDLVHDICSFLSEKDLSLYLLGADQDVSVATKFELEKKYPNLIISGIKGGFSKEDISDETLIEAVNKAMPDVLLVALGHPYQEKWIYNNLDKLPSVKLAMGVGGTFDFISRKKMRAPGFLQKINLEWLWRFFIEPKRWKRIKNAVWNFPLKVFQYKVNLLDQQENFAEVIQEEPIEEPTSYSGE